MNMSAPNVFSALKSSKDSLKPFKLQPFKTKHPVEAAVSSNTLVCVGPCHGKFWPDLGPCVTLDQASKGLLKARCRRRQLYVKDPSSHAEMLTSFKSVIRHWFVDSER